MQHISVLQKRLLPIFILAIGFYVWNVCSGSGVEHCRSGLLKYCYELFYWHFVAFKMQFENLFEVYLDVVSDEQMIKKAFLCINKWISQNKCTMVCKDRWVKRREDPWSWCSADWCLYVSLNSNFLFPALSHSLFWLVIKTGNKL